ncbi:MAG TPA: helix-turn-helix transcriptional regulator [Myxococcaceae bacterium]|nr:helix-turn-helix transcriptional regulator [Myxococcaceae bacterium]
MSSFPISTLKISQLARLLRETRTNAGLTQQQVADAIDLSVPIYGRIERASMIPAEHTLRSICAVLKLDYEAVVASMRDDESVVH